MIKRIYKNTLVILLPAALISAFIEWEKLPLGIIVGGLLALANLKAIVWSVEGLIGTTDRAAGMLVFFSFLKLLVIFAIIIFLLWLGIINIIGIFIGFTIVFVLILIEGLRSVKGRAQ
ncbi:MAG: hypothetical protein LLF28_04815 [Nitrospiraceae bacterium]|nr:hypothetical protein [Nitrospiraceae bacterium]